MRKLDATGFEKALHTVVAPLAVDILLIVGPCVEWHKRLSLFLGPCPQECIEHLFPCRRVNTGGSRNDAIEVEQNGIEPVTGNGMRRRAHLIMSSGDLTRG